MVILVILVLSDSSKDSVGTPAGRVILFGTIPTTIPDTTPVITPLTTQTDTTVLPTETPIITPTIPPSPDYTPASLDYSPASEIESDPSEDPSSGHIPPLPAVSPFLSSDDDTKDSDTPDTHHHLPMAHLSLRLPLLPRDHLKRVGPLPVQQLAGHLARERMPPVISVPALPPVSGALSIVRADLIPSPKRVRDIGYLADIEVGPRETGVERVTHPAMPEDMPEPTQEGAVIEGVQRDQGHRIVGVESVVAALTEMVAELERDNRRHRGTARVKSQIVN
nr:hypothetical protein [Tanacetum cinerariifolium]